MMIIDKGLNDKWVRPCHWKRTRPGRYTLTLKEPLGKLWTREIVSYDLPEEIRGNSILVRSDGRRVPCQESGGRLAILVENLRPNETRTFEVERSGAPVPKPQSGVQFTKQGDHVLFSNGLLSLKLPAGVRGRLRGAVPGPILAVGSGRGPWLGRGRIEGPLAPVTIHTRVVEQGELWTTAEVAYEFEGGSSYCVRLTLRPNENACEVHEESTLPVRLWPAQRPYREIGTLGKSHWDQPLEAVAKPCLRPCPTSNFLLDVRAGFRPDRMVTHSTGSWEIMDMPLGAATLKTYTAMRPALPFIDGGWLGVYESGRDDLIGVAALDIAHWRAPDDVVHPAHRTPGASAEVLLCDSKADGTHFRFPIENMSRRWLLTVLSRRSCRGLGDWKKPRGKAVRLGPDHESPLWALHTRGDLRLDKVKEWVVDWPDSGAAHPRVLCRRSDFAAIRKKMQTVPEFRRNHAQYKQWRGADRYILNGERASLKEIEAQTHAKQLLEGILARGYTGPCYCIAFARPLRRYAIACDILWDTFTAEEKREARRVCALAAYILSDGDWWQFAYRPNETTYLPNFNTDVFTCAGIIGLFLHDHPCSRAWVDFCVERMDIELKHYVRRDGGGEENVGGYYFSTWTMLYMPAFWALRHCGVKDYSKDPRVLAGARYMLNVFGPRDPRDGGRRMGPPIGHHPHARKAFPLFDWVAAFIRKADPVLASHLKWAWRACGSPVGNLHDHFGPKANPYTRHYLFHDPTIPAVEPALKSHNLPHVGAVLRSHDASGKGSYLFLKAGRVHSHHDEDEGSFHYFGRGIPLALDGLQIQNGAKAWEHNAVTFARSGQPTAIVEQFRTTPVADYVRARTAPRAFCCDANYVDGTHRSGWDRELVLVKADKPGGIEYLVIKDTVAGPDACQWNLDVLSQKPSRLNDGHVWFPGHREFNMGLDVIVVEPGQTELRLEKGIVNPQLLSARERRRLPAGMVDWTTTEHWLLHIPAPPGTTFCIVLFPRRPGETSPIVEYCVREETVSIRHDEGCDLVFLRPNPMVGTSIQGALFRGRAGIVRQGNRRKKVQPLDGEQLRLADHPDDTYRVL